MTMKTYELGIFIVLLVASTTVSGQVNILFEEFPDTIRTLLNQKDSRAEQVKFLLQQAERYQDENTVLANQCAATALTLAEKIKPQSLYGEALFWSAFLQLELQPYNDAREQVLQRAKLAAHIFQKESIESWLSRCLVLVADIYYKDGNPSAAYDMIDSVQNLIDRRIQDHPQHQLLLAEKSYVEGKIQLYYDELSADQLFQQSLRLFQETKDQGGQGKTIIAQAFIAPEVEKENVHLEAINILSKGTYTIKLQVAWIEYGVFCIKEYYKSGRDTWYEKSLVALNRASQISSTNACEIQKQLGITNHWKAHFLKQAKENFLEAIKKANVHYEKALIAAEEEGNFECMKDVAREIKETCAFAGKCKQSIEDLTTVFATVLKTRQETSARVEKEKKDYQLYVAERIATQRQRIIIISAVSLIAILSISFFIYHQRKRLKLLQKKLKAEKEAGLAQQAAFAAQLNQVEAEKEARLAQQSAFRAQLNPHFVSNALSAIDDLVNFGDRRKASHYLIRFHRLCRMVINSSRYISTSLADEIKMLNHLLEIEKLRLPEKLNYSITVDPELNAEKIQFPSLILQPFVENAIWHGIQPKDSPGFLKIEVAKFNEGFLQCMVEDNGIGRKQAKELSAQSLVKSTSWGTKISKERIDTMEGSSLTLIDLYDKENHKIPLGTRVELIIPIKLY